MSLPRLMLLHSKSTLSTLTKLVWMVISSRHSSRQSLFLHRSLHTKVHSGRMVRAKVSSMWIRLFTLLQMTVEHRKTRMYIRVLLTVVRWKTIATSKLTWLMALYTNRPKKSQPTWLNSSSIFVSVQRLSLSLTKHAWKTWLLIRIWKTLSQAMTKLNCGIRLKVQQKTKTRVTTTTSVERMQILWITNNLMIWLPLSITWWVLMLQKTRRTCLGIMMKH